MAFKQYVENGVIKFKVSVVGRSKRVPGLRVQRKRLGLQSEAEAKRAERQLHTDVQREIFEREIAGVSWKSLIDDWELALRKGRGLTQVGPCAAADYVSALRIYTSGWSKKAAESITTADVNDVVFEMQTNAKSDTRKQAVLTAINQIYRWAIANRLVKGLSQSPAFGVKIKACQTKKPEILSIGQIKKLLEAAKGYNHVWYPIWAVALLTGMRSGELQALEWTDVDFEARILTVSKSYNGRLKIVKSTKAGYWREVPINDDLMLLLKQLRLESGGRKHVLPRINDWKDGEAAKVLRTFCYGIGIPSVRFHALRACFATQLLKSKVAPAVVMKICGWKDLKTMQRYIRLAGIEIEGATDSLQLLSETETMGKVVQLWGNAERSCP